MLKHIDYISWYVLEQRIKRKGGKRTLKDPDTHKNDHTTSSNKQITPDEKFRKMSGTNKSVYDRMPIGLGLNKQQNGLESVQIVEEENSAEDGLDKENIVHFYENGKDPLSFYLKRAIR